MSAPLRITSAANPVVKSLKALHLKKGRSESGLFLAEGARLASEAADLGVWPQIMAVSEAALERPQVKKLVSAAAKAGARVIETSEAILGQIGKRDNPQTIIGAYRQRFAPLDELPTETPGFFVALEGVRDPGNLGTIIRTADAAGATGIILVGQSCDPWGPDCVRATMGSIFGVPLVRLASVDFLDLCRAWPGESVGTHLRATESFRRSYRQPSLLVMGSEGKGLSDEASAACSALVRIPMREGAESLNVAIATGLILYEALKR